MSTQQNTVKQALYSSSLLGVALLAALLFNGNHLYHLAATWLTLALWFLYQFSLQKEVRFSVDVVLLAVAFFASWMLISLFWHPIPWMGDEVNWRLGVYLFSLLAVYYVAREQGVAVLLNVLLFVAVIVAVYSLFQSFYLGEAAAGFSANKNNNAAFMNLFLLPVMALLLLSNMSTRSYTLMGMIFILFLLVVLQVASRGASISLALAAILPLAFAVYKKRMRQISYLIVLFSIALLLDALFSSVEMTSNLQSHSRWLLWRATIEMIGDAGWMGIGSGMFYLLYPGYRYAGEKSQGHFVHNDYLQILLELGVPGLLALLFLMCVVVLKSRKLIIAEQNSPDNARHIGLMAALIAVAIHSMVTFNFYKLGILLVLGVYSGILLKASQSVSAKALYTYTVRVSPRSIALLTVLLLFLVKPILLMGYADAVAEGFIDNRIVSSSDEEKYHIYSKLHSMDPLYYGYPYLMAVNYSNLGEGRGLEKRRLIFNLSRELLHDAQKLNPYVVEPIMFEAELFNNYQDVVGQEWSGQAIPLAYKALKKNPRRLDIRYRVGVLLEYAGDEAAALDTIVEGLEVNSRASTSYYELGLRLAKSVGDADAMKRFSELLEEENAKAAQDFSDLLDEYKMRKSGAGQVN